MYTLEELQPKIIEWAREKDLIKLENAPKQRLKLIEECGELASAILKNNVELQKDAVGDIFVVILILAEQLQENLDPISAINQAEETKPANINEIPIWSFISLICGNNDCYDNTMYLKCISIQLDLDLTECANLAWNEIKDRKGNTINGTFLKN